MKLQHLLHFSKSSFYKSLFAALLLISLVAQNSYASLDRGVGRIRQCNVTNNVATPEGLDFDPTSGGMDAEFVLSNSVCLAVIISSYATVKVAIATMNGVCSSGSPIPRVQPSIFSDARDIARASSRSAIPGCLAARNTALASLNTALTELGIIYGMAQSAYEDTSVCGANWMKASSNTLSFSAPDYKQEVQDQIDSWLRNNQNSSLTFDEQKYREWYYGGVEFEDNPDSGATCYDPTKTTDRNAYPKQKFYLKGLASGNYHCSDYLIREGQNDPADPTRALTEARLADFKTAHECCISRSRDYICLSVENVANSYAGSSLSSVTQSRRNVFCRAGERCNVNDITFYSRFMDNNNLICAESYSLCPYNFSVGGGTEYCDYYRDGTWNSDNKRWDIITAAEIEAGSCATNSEIRNADCTYNNKAGQCRNYCQYLTHCTKTSYTNPYVSGLESPYFSEACMNFIGDSQNSASLGGGVIIGNQKHFSTPIAQCVKETLENVFYNRAGHSKCLNINELPSRDGTCPSGSYVTEGNFIFQRGHKVQDESFFETVQNKLQTAVKLVLTLSIMLYGMNLLIWKSDIRNKKDILVYFLKIALVLYFATGDAWQNMFFGGVYGASTELSRLVFKIKTQEDESKRDGCQFGRIYLPDGSEAYSSRLYPAGKEYLAIWDTLDCKLMRYLGFGPEASASNIAMLVFAGFFTGPIGLYFALSVMIFGILFLAAVIRALHIFLSSSISIIIMVFVSPIIIPLLLFEKTKNIFDNWLKELISFSLQPMILFAYIAIFIMVIDQTLIGSANFKGSPPFKDIECAARCVDVNGAIVPFQGDQAPACDENGQRTVDPNTDSVACLINFNEFAKFPGLQIIGISIPILYDLLESNTKEKVLTLLKGTLVMYIMYKFMDEIPGVTNSLVGGTALPTSSANGGSMFMKMLNRARGIQKRLGRGSLKAGKALTKGSSKRIERLSNRGKNPDTEGGGGGSDKVSSKLGSGSDDSAKGGDSGDSGDSVDKK